MIGKIGGFVCSLSGVIVLLFGFTSPTPMYLMAASAILFLLAALMWEIGNCSIFLQALTRDAERAGPEGKQPVRRPRPLPVCPACGAEIGALATFCISCHTTFDTMLDELAQPLQR